MHSSAITPQQYMDSLPDDRKQAMNELRKSIKQNLPKDLKK
jgi:translation elongation factor EF-1beta